MTFEERRALKDESLFKTFVETVPFKVKTRLVCDTVMLDIVFENGHTIPIMGLDKYKDRKGQQWYKSDTVSNSFRSIAQAKNWVKDNYKQFLFD